MFFLVHVISYLSKAKFFTESRLLQRPVKVQILSLPNSTATPFQSSANATAPPTASIYIGTGQTRRHHNRCLLLISFLSNPPFGKHHRTSGRGRASTRGRLARGHARQRWWNGTSPCGREACKGKTFMFIR